MDNERKSTNPFYQNQTNRSSLPKEVVFQYDRKQTFELSDFFDISIQNLFTEDMRTCLYSLHDIILSLKLSPILSSKITEKEIALIRQWILLESTPIQSLSYDFFSILIKCDKHKLSILCDQDFISFSIQNLPLSSIVNFFDVCLSVSADFYHKMIEYGLPQILISLTYPTEPLPEQFASVLHLLRYFIGGIDLPKEEWFQILILIHRTFLDISPKEISMIIEFIQEISNPLVHEAIVDGPIYRFFIANFDSRDFINVRQKILNYFSMISKAQKFQNF